MAGDSIISSWQERNMLARKAARRKAEDKKAEEEVTKGLGARVLARGDIDRMMRTVQDAMERGEGWLRELGYGGLVIDEVALLLPEGKHGDEWFECMLHRVGKRGISYFNQSTDQVRCEPLPSGYEVQYDFFSTDLAVRLELLRLRGGYSPLHDLYRREGRASGVNADVVHVSFKVPDEEALRLVYREMAERGWMLGQDCASRYGRFGYWRKPNEEGPLLWLKPRVNLRDVVGPTEEPERQGRIGDPVVEVLPEYDEDEDEDEEGGEDEDY